MMRVTMPADRTLASSATQPTTMTVKIGVRVVGWTYDQARENGSILSRPRAYPTRVAAVMLASRAENMAKPRMTSTRYVTPEPKWLWMTFTNGVPDSLSRWLMEPLIAIEYTAKRKNPASPPMMTARRMALGMIRRASRDSSARSADASHPRML